MTGSHPAHAYSANRVIDYDEWTNPDLIEERFSAAKVQYSRGFEVMENPKKRQVQAPQEALPLVAAIYTLVSNYHGLSDTDWYNDLTARLEKVVENIKGMTPSSFSRITTLNSNRTLWRNLSSYQAASKTALSFSLAQSGSGYRVYL